MKVRIEIDTRTFVRFWLVVIGFVLAALIIYSARTALIIIGTALFLALALNVPVSKLASRLPGKSRGISTAISYFVIVSVISVFSFLAVPPIIQQTARFVETLPTVVNDATKNWHVLDSAIEEYELQPQVDEALASIKGNASKIASSAGSTLINSLSSVFGFLAASVLVLVLSILMLIEGPGLMNRFWGLYQDPVRMKRHRSVIHKMHSVVSGYVVGQLTVSSIGAVFAGLVVFLLSFFFEVPANLAIPSAAITFVLSLVPMFGAMIGGFLVAILLGFNAVGAAVVYLIYFVVYQQIENNFISPTIQAKRLELSPLAILASVTVGLYLFGIAGGIISIPIAGSIKVLVDDYLEHNRKKRERAKPLHNLVKNS